MTTSNHDKLLDLLKDFDVAMLVTRQSNGQMRSRPMALADVEADGTLWFLTQGGSGKMGELAHDNHVNVAFQSRQKFISLTGTATAVNDRAKLVQIWKESWRVWFPGGKDDPELVLLRVTGESGEYWDNSGMQGIKYLIEAGRAYLAGTRPKVDDDQAIHARVEL